MVGHVPFPALDVERLRRLVRESGGYGDRVLADLGDVREMARGDGPLAATGTGRATAYTHRP